MIDLSARAAMIGGIGLLERAVNYALGNLHLVTPADLSGPTPCPDWDLRALLNHLDDSLMALHEAIDTGRVDLDAPGHEPDPPGDRMPGRAPDLVTTVRDHARQLIGAWTNAEDGQQLVSIAGSPLTTGIVTSTGAIEIAVHGWDVARSCGLDRPIPASLAEELLQLAPLFVTDADRPARFGPAVDVPPLAGPGQRLVAFLGRRPARGRPDRG